jgi:quercetin dioxygenase-like cupin family protein
MNATTLPTPSREGVHGLELEPYTVTRSQERQAYWLVHEQLTPLVGAAETNGQYDVVETVAMPNGGPPPHLHRREDELFLVVEGTFQFIFNDQATTAGPGTAVFLPRDVVHTYNNVGDTPGKLLVVASPSGFNKFIADAGCPCHRDRNKPEVGPAVFEKLQAACRQHWIEMKPDWAATRPLPVLPKRKELWVIGLHVKLLLTAEETNGRFSVAELSPDPGVFVPNHRHKAEDEMFYVTDGTVWFEVGGESVTATAGTFVYIPRGTLHGFRNIGHRRAKMLNVHTPGGFDKFFEASGMPCEDIDAGPPNIAVDFAKFALICHNHGMELGEAPAPE